MAFAPSDYPERGMRASASGLYFSWRSEPNTEEAKMSDVQVTCVTRSSSKGAHEAITHLGGNNWKWTSAQVIESIRAKTNTFYTSVGGRRAEIRIVSGPSGDYLRTYADGAWSDNLLALPSCP